MITFWSVCWREKVGGTARFFLTDLSHGFAWELFSNSAGLISVQNRVALK